MDALSTLLRPKTVLAVLGVLLALTVVLGLFAVGSGADGTGAGGTGSGDSQYYDGGSIVRDEDGTIYYSDDNGYSVSVGG